jgi:hypothetical protein
VLFVAGLLLYLASERLRCLGVALDCRCQETRPETPFAAADFHFVFCGGVIACAGAIFDPRRRFEILNSGALSSFVAAIGPLKVPQFFPQFTEKTIAPPEPVQRGIAWIIATSVASMLFVFALGPGIKF